MDNSAAAVGYLGPISGTRADQYNRRLEWSVSPQDISKSLVMSFVYNLPFGKGQKLLNSSPRVANLLVAGWQVNGILTFQTGTPIVVGGALNQTGLLTANQRPDNSGQPPAVLAHNRWALLTTSANLLSAEGKTVEALAAGSDAWDLARAMRRDGNRFLTEEDCAVTLTALAACHIERFKVDKDPAHLTSALEHLEAAAAIDRARLPVGGPHAHFDLAAVLYAQGDAHLRGGDPARAAAALRDALAHLDEALAGEPERADWREQKQRIETLLASLGREADPALNPKSGSD